MMIKKLYYWLLQKSAKPIDRGGVSAGYWQGKIREAALRSIGKGPDKVLDIGCGEGLLLRDMLKENPSLHLYGIDLSFSQLQDAKARAGLASSDPARLAQSNALLLPFKDGAFDRIIFINLVINMPSQDMVGRLVMEAGRVCKKGGSIVFDIRNRLSPIIRIKYALAKYYDATIDTKDLPLTMCDPMEIERISGTAGLEIAKRSYLGFPKGRYAPVIIFEMRKIR
jgi:ubiquinone/menaquinone biosynthesis C-methylase UbiE